MKLQQSLFVILTVGLVALCHGQSYSLSTTELQEQIRFLQAKHKALEAAEKICPEKVTELSTAINEMRQCVLTANLQEKTKCSLLKEDLLRCSKPIIDVLNECQDKEFGEIVEFLLKITKNVAKYLCKQDGEHIFELGNSCALKSTRQLERCIRMGTSKIQQYENDLPSEAQLCDTMGTLKNCFLSHIQTSCKNEITRDSFNGFANAIMSTCESTNLLTENNFKEIK